MKQNAPLSRRGLVPAPETSTRLRAAFDAVTSTMADATAQPEKGIESHIIKERAHSCSTAPNPEAAKWPLEGPSSHRMPEEFCLLSPTSIAPELVQLLKSLVLEGMEIEALATAALDRHESIDWRKVKVALEFQTAARRALGAALARTASRSGS